MARKRVFNRTHLVVDFILTFLVGWLSFAYYGYTNQVLYVDVQGMIVDGEAISHALYSTRIDRSVKAVILYLRALGAMAYPFLMVAVYVEALAEEKLMIPSWDTMYL